MDALDLGLSEAERGDQEFNDARTTHTGVHSDWLYKMKSDNSRWKWLATWTTRYFTIDFDKQIFYYAHTNKTDEMLNLTPFREILGAERIPANFGFTLKTQERTFELFSTSNANADTWVSALIAAGDIGRNAKHVFEGGKDLEAGPTPDTASKSGGGESTAQKLLSLFSKDQDGAAAPKYYTDDKEEVVPPLVHDFGAAKPVPLRLECSMCKKKFMVRKEKKPPLPCCMAFLPQPCVKGLSALLG